MCLMEGIIFCVFSIIRIGRRGRGRCSFNKHRRGKSLGCDSCLSFRAMFDMAATVRMQDDFLEYEYLTEQAGVPSHDDGGAQLPLPCVPYVFSWIFRKCNAVSACNFYRYGSFFLALVGMSGRMR